MAAGLTGKYAILHIGDAEYFPVFWGCALAGVIPVTVGKPESLGYVWEKLRQPTIIGGTKEAAALRHMPFAAQVVPAQALMAADVTATQPTAQPDDIAMLQLSSGSTGRPKIVQITHRGISEYAIGARQLLDIAPGDTLLNWLPLDHVAGLMLYHLGGTFLGASTVQAATEPVLADPLRWLDLMHDYRATHGWAPTFAYRLVTDALAAQPERAWDLRQVKRFVSGGEQCTPAVFDSFVDATARFGVRRAAIAPGWGMSETCTGITFASLGEDWCRQGEHLSVGRPAPGATLRIVDGSFNVLPEGEVGRLHVKSARVTPGYIDDPDADREAFAEPGWLDSGDLAYMLDGRITVVGREKDLVIINGHNYACHEIEEAVRDVHGIRDHLVAACGIPDVSTGTERLVLFYVPSGRVSHPEVAAAIVAAIGERLRLPVTDVVAVPEFPRTSAGKIQRRLLRERYLTTHDPGSPSLPTRLGRPVGEGVASRGAWQGAGDEAGGAAAVRQVVAQVVAGLVPGGAEVDAGKPFYELGLGSVQIVQLQARLTDRLGRDVPATALFAHPTIDALSAFLATQGEAPLADRLVDAASDRRIAIVGMAARFPGAPDIAAYWANLTAGVESIKHFSAQECAAAGLPVNVPGFVAASGVVDDVDAFDAAFFGISAKEAELLDPQHRVFLEVCYNALEHAGYAGAEHETTGLFAGSGMNLYPHHTYLRNNLSQVTASGNISDAIGAALGSQPDFFATRVAYRLGLTGPAINVQTACSTSLVAVHLAVQSILSGECDLAVAGAAAIHVPQVTGYHYSPDSILSPDGRCRPFDAEAAGTVGGNGAAAIVLKPLSKALADGDTVHAVILATAVNNDGGGKAGYTAPGVQGHVEVIRAAVRKADVPAESVGYVEAHGTGTPLGDPVEFEALLTAYPQGGFLGSVKANIGHLDSCSGMAGLIKTVLMVREGLIPPQLNFARPNPALGFGRGAFKVATSLMPWPDGIRRAGVSALGVGGTNAHVIVEQPPADTLSPTGDEVGVLPVSAADPVALRQLSQAYERMSVRHRDAVLTAGAGRRHRRHRLARLGSGEALTGDVPVAGLGPVAFAFAGQGTLLHRIPELVQRFPAVGEVWQQLDSALAQRVAEGDTSTEVAQPALVALGIGLASLWRQWGIEPQFVTGHSVGELAALAVAGVLEPQAAVELAALRGRLMASLMPAGAMAAVFGDRSVVDDVLARVPDLELAASNAPGRFVVAGPPSAIDRALGLGVAIRKLAVSRAFHTAAVEPFLGPWQEALASMTFGPSRLVFVSTVDGQPRPLGWVPDAGYLCRQARQPVLFAAAVSVLSSAGCGLVIEAGPDAVLSTLAGPGWIASQPPELPAVEGIWHAVGSAYVSGAALDWAAITAGSSGRRVPLPPYPFQRKRYWISTVDTHLDRVRALTAASLGVPVAEVDADDAFLALGADSLLLASMAAELQREFGRRVPVRDLFGDLCTPRKVATFLNSAGPLSAATTRPSATVDLAIASGRAVAAGSVATPSHATAAGHEAAAGFSAAASPVATAGLAANAANAAAAQLAAFASHPNMVGHVGEVTPSASVGEAVLGGAVRPEGTGVVAQIIQQQLEVMRQQLAVLQGTAAPATPRSAPVEVTERPKLDRLSLYFFGDYPASTSQGKYQLILDAAEFADTHGLHAVWIPERHFHSFGGLFPNPSVLAAAIAARTKQIRINAGSVVLPLHHPVRVAEEWSMVDNISGGRVGIGVAPGWHANDFVFFPENYGRAKQVMFEHLETVRKLWRGQTVSAVAGDGKAIDVSLHPLPVQPMPPFFNAIVGNPDSYREAARRDLGVVTNLMTQDVTQLAKNIALYRKTRAEHGLDPAGGHVTVLLHTYLGGDLEAVRASAFEPFCAYLKSSFSLLGQVTNSLGMNIDLENTPEDDLRFILGRAYERYCAERALIGTPQSCADVLSSVLQAGADEIACFVDFGLPAELVRAGLPFLTQLEAKTVRPSVRKAPLSPPQRRMWLNERLYPNRAAYNEAAAIRLDGRLDAEALRGALADVVARHAPLRTTYVDEVQLIERHVTVECPVVECGGRDLHEVVRQELAALSRPVFDLSRGPVFRFRLLRFSPERHVLIAAFHHIAADGRSYAVFTREVSAFYRARVSATAPVLPPLKAEYADVDWPQPSDADLSYWRTLLEDAPPNLTLPSDLPRPAEPAETGRSIFFTIPAERVRQFGREHRVTPFTVFLAAFAVTLTRHGDQQDLIVGTGVANRTEQTNDLIGFFVDTLPLRLSVAGDPTFAELTARVQATAADAYDHASVAFEELVTSLAPTRAAGRNPFFDIAIEYETGGAFAFDLPGIAATPLDAGLNKAPVDLMVYLSYQDDLRCHVEFRTDVLDETSVRRLFADFKRLLDIATANPAVPLSTLEISASVLEGPHTAEEPHTLADLFVQQANLSPDAVAIREGESAWTYAELHEQALRLSKDLDIEAGNVVAVVLPRGGDLIAAQLAVMLAGGVFLPIDPATPEARVAELCRDSGARLRLLAAGPVALDGPHRRAEATWCLYTSGSTGRPKGVLVPRAAAVNAMQWHVGALSLGAGDRVAHGLGLGFDANLAEIYPALVAGAAVHPVPAEVRLDPAALVEWWRAEQITVAFLPAAVAELVFDFDVPLRVLVVGGSALKRRPPKGFRAQVLNAYGPTENAIVATAGVVAPESGDVIDIGVPIDNVTVRIADSQGQTVALGAVGEIVLSGRSLASYVDDPRLPSEYFTGDRGRIRGDGTIEFLGRTDGQVKIAGHRVEPGEVEAVLARIPGVVQTAVVARHDRGAEPYLAAYVVGADPREALSARVPAHLVPTAWVFLSSLPLTPSGKVDVAALPAPAALAVAAQPATERERAVHAAWCEELGVAALPLEASFFAAGGNSLAAMRVANRLGIPVHKVLEATGIAALAQDMSVIASGPAAYQQELMWHKQAINPDPAAVHIALRMTLTGALDLTAMTAAWNTLVERHATIRTRLVKRDGVLMQEVLPHVPLSIAVTDIGEADVDGWCVAEGRRAFSGTPLLRVSVARVSQRQAVMMVVVHHLAADGWSILRLLSELQSLYSGCTLPALGLSYVDYAVRQRETPAVPSVLDYWRSQLAGVPRTLRIAGEREASSRVGAEFFFTVPAGLTASLRSLARQQDTSLFTVVASAYGTLLGELTGNEEVVLACPYAHRQEASLESVVGFFSSAVMLRLRPLDDVNAYLASASVAYREALRHQPMFLPVLMRELDPDWVPGKPAPFGDAMFAWNPGLPTVDLPGLTVVLEDQPLACARRELATVLMPSGDELRGSIEYNTSLFDAATVAEISSRYLEILARFSQTAG